MIELLKTNGEKLRPFSESSRLYTVREKKNDPYIDPFIDSDLSFPDPPIAKQKQNLVLISLNRCGMVVVGLGASLKGENQIWSEKRILLYFQIIMS